MSAGLVAIVIFTRLIYQIRQKSSGPDQADPDVEIVGVKGNSLWYFLREWPSPPGRVIPVALKGAGLGTGRPTSVCMSKADGPPSAVLTASLQYRRAVKNFYTPNRRAVKNFYTPTFLARHLTIQLGRAPNFR